MGKKKKALPKHLWAVFDSAGECFGSYITKNEAEEDVWGPRFKKGHTIRAYRLVSRKEDPKRAAKPKGQPS